MRSLEPFWRSANSVADDCTTYAHWREMLGDHLPIFEHLLLGTDQLGSHIPKPGCKYTWFAIEDDGDDQIILFDEDTGEIWHQPKRDGLAFEVNWRLIYRMLLDGVGIEFGYRKLDGLKFIHRIGADRPAMGVELPVYHHGARPEVELSELLLMTDGPFVFAAFRYLRM